MGGGASADLNPETLKTATAGQLEAAAAGLDAETRAKILAALDGKQPAVSIESAVAVTLDIKPDRVDDFLKAMEDDAKKSRDLVLDPGCIRFDLLRDRDDPNRFVIYEAYTDDDAMAFHKTTSHYKSWADFKSSGGVASQSVAKLESGSIAGGWAFQRESCGTVPTGSAVLVTLVIKPDRVDDFIKAMEIDARQSRLEAGCFRFDLLRDREDLTKFMLYEAYKDDEAASFHKTTAHYDTWAAFKKTEGVLSQTVVKVECASIPGGWAFQP